MRRIKKQEVCQSYNALRNKNDLLNRSTYVITLASHVSADSFNNL